MTKLFLMLSLMVISAGLYAQNKITGTITDETGVPLPGVNIQIFGTLEGTITDNDGNYSIVANTGDTITYSFVGYIPKLFEVKNESAIKDFQLMPDIVGLNEYVIIGYGSSKSKDLTAPIKTITSKDIEGQLTANPAQALQGKMAGLTVTNAGEPGSQPQIKIRGVGTVYGEGGGPLYIVDGAIVRNISFLNNNDIETITVLKDASAGAIYGVQAANGVILVTTKKGKSGKPILNFSTYTGVQVPTNIMKMSNTSQYIELINQKAGLTGNGSAFKVSDYPASTQWYDELLTTPIITNHELGLSGGTDKFTWTYGLSYFYQDGILDSRNTDNRNNFNRLNFRARNDYKLTKNISLGFNFIMSKSQNTPAYNYAFYQAYVTPPAYLPGNEVEGWTDPTSLGFSGPFANPVASAYYFNKKADEYTIIPNTYLSIDFLEHFNFRTSFNADIGFLANKEYNPKYYISGLQNSNTTSLDRFYELRRNFVVDNTLEFSNTVNNHDFKLLVGNSIQQQFLNRLSGKAYNVPYVSDATLYLSTGNETTRTGDDSGEKYNVLSYFSRLSYSFNGKYLLNATIRADGSSKYNEKWGYFPSVGAGWVLSQEDFMDGQNIFDFLKIRASWGKLGNNNIPANSSYIVGKPSAETTGIFGGNNPLPGITFQTVYNNYLMWESIEEYDGGIEFYLLKNKLHTEIDYYNRITNNAVFPYPITGVSGSATLLGNNGKIQNSGVEVSLTYSHKPQSSDFSYEISGNFTTIKNKILEINNESGVIYGPTVNGAFVTKTIVNEPIGSFYGYEAIGVFQTNGEINDYKGPEGQILQSDAIPGDLKFKNNTEDGSIDDKDRILLGSPIPKFTYGLSANLIYKRWDLNLTLQGMTGNKIFNEKRAGRNAFPDANYDLDFYENHWTGKGSTNEYPSAALNRKNIQPNSFFVESGSYLRVRNVQLGYNLPSDIFSGYTISNFRIYLSAQNPFTYFTYNGYTPEIGGEKAISTGIDNDTYPLSAIYTIGLNLTF